MAKNKAGVNKNRKHIKIFGDDAHILPAPEPSDVLWENLEVTKST